MAVLRAPGGAVQATIDDIEAQLPALKARYPKLEFSVADTQGELIQISNNNMQEALRDAIIFTSMVDPCSSSATGAPWPPRWCHPAGVPLTLAIPWLFGKELNILVMTGVILALGMLVDDAVVVLENIERHLDELHEDVQTAVKKGTEEVLYPVFVGTVATAAVISPLMFVGDFSQQIFKHLVLAVVIAVFTSYFVAVTFIPRLSAFWYRNGLQPKPPRAGCWKTFITSTGGAVELYTGMLRFALRGGFPRRLILAFPPFALLVFSFKTIIPLIGKEAMPPMDTGYVRVHQIVSANQPVADAEARLKEFEARPDEDKRVKRVSATFGSEAGVIPRLRPAARRSHDQHHLVNRLERDETSWQIEADLRRQLAALPG